MIEHAVARPVVEAKVREAAIAVLTGQLTRAAPGADYLKGLDGAIVVRRHRTGPRMNLAFTIRSHGQDLDLRRAGSLLNDGYG